ncbi:GGDEF domain-containing protein [Pseudoalteromonas luteoviolacea]|uniref:tetratricopeptide repeat-containing diguanylate cyclase n=1 Tax=Pseudoalteromonas luteoviolacea TaxID=43657 RepID=UPI001F2188DC|nr:GGDEF domain-containing protein [Pseudoalteromonas luteoviolacea]MCF6440851.1 GGDEF domain-containing protein [Pseudoalteromonas luteoviolacea]
MFYSLSASALSKKQLLEFESSVVSFPSHLLQMESTPPGVDKLLWLTLKARAAFFRGDINTAAKLFDLGKPAAQSSPLQLTSGYWFLYRAFFSVEQGDLNKAKQYIKQASLCFAQSKDSDFLIRAHAMEAIISVWREEYSTALKRLQSAQGLMSKSSIEQDDVTKLLVYDALTAYYSTLKFYVKALGYAHQAQELADRKNNVLDGLPVKYNLCLTLLRAELLEKAKVCYTQMFEASEEHDLPRYEFWALSGLGKIALSEKTFELAIKHLNLAQRAQKNAIINPAHIIVLHNNLGYAYAQTKMFDKALEQITFSKQVLSTYHSPLNNRYMRQTLKIEADVHQAKQDFPQTVSTLRTYIRLLEESEVKKQETQQNNNQSAIMLEPKGKSRQLNELGNNSTFNEDTTLKKAYILIVFLFVCLVGLVIYHRQSKRGLTEALYYKDIATGLYNKRYFIEKYDDFINLHLDYAMALIEINPESSERCSNGGFENTDLKFIADQLLMQFRDDGDLVCRVSEHEFVIVCLGMKKPLLQKRLAAFQQVLITKNKKEPLIVSGALICSDEGDFGNIFAELESRLVHVKRTARGQVVSF